MAEHKRRQPAPAMMLGEAVEAWMADRLARSELTPRVARGYRSAARSVVAAVGDKPVSELDVDDMAVWWESLAARRPATMATYRRQVRIFFGWLQRQRLMTVDPLPSEYQAARAERVATAPAEATSAHGMTVATAAEAWVSEKERRQEIVLFTAANYRSALRRFVDIVGDLPVAELTADHVDLFLSETRDRAASTRAGYFCAVSGLHDWLRRRGHLAVDLMEEFKQPKRPRRVPRYVPKEDVGRLLAACPDARARAIVLVMVGMGLRCREVCLLEMADWDRGRDVMLVHGKGDREREVPVPSMVAEAIDSYLAEHPTTSAGSVFRSYGHRGRQDLGAALDPNYLSEKVSRWMREAGIKSAARDGRSGHALRHTAASDVLDRCKDIRVVQQMLGHAHLSTTEVYLRRADLTAMAEAMEGRSYRAPA